MTDLENKKSLKITDADTDIAAKNIVLIALLFADRLLFDFDVISKPLAFTIMIVTVAIAIFLNIRAFLHMRKIKK